MIAGHGYDDGVLGLGEDALDQPTLQAIPIEEILNPGSSVVLISCLVGFLRTEHGLVNAFVQKLIKSGGETVIGSVMSINPDRILFKGYSYPKLDYSGPHKLTFVTFTDGTAHDRNNFHFENDKVNKEDGVEVEVSTMIEAGSPPRLRVGGIYRDDLMKSLKELDPSYVDDYATSYWSGCITYFAFRDLIYYDATLKKWKKSNKSDDFKKWLKFIYENIHMFPEQIVNQLNIRDVDLKALFNYHLQGNIEN